MMKLAHRPPPPAAWLFFGVFATELAMRVAFALV